jgi:peptidoglycan/xylan/chitin deacetylase (PgdA/CDA1 family)
MYPYGIFCVGTGLSAEGGLSVQRSFSATVFQRKRSGNKVAYLTFDDGPIPEVTPKVLDILARYGVKATFFMVGENIDKHPEVFQQVLAAGHTIGNHTYNHLKGWNVSLEEYLANVAKCEIAMKNHLSPFTFHLSPLFRPPYGKATFLQRRALHKKGYRLIYWDILTRDYNPTRTPEAMFRQIQRETRAGSIINFHDSLKSNERMLEVLPRAIEWLQAQGYVLDKLKIED